MKRNIVFTCFLFIYCPAYAADLYQAVLHVIASNGKYEKMVLKNTEDGVSRVECELRGKIWLKEFGSAMDAAGEKIKKSGHNPGEYRLECERIVR